MTEREEQMIYDEGFRRGFENGYEACRDDVAEKMAELTAARPKGEWTIHYDKVENGMGGTYRERRWYCSACGKWQTYGETDFCPNCGADMRGADNETD